MTYEASEVPEKKSMPTMHKSHAYTYTTNIIYKQIQCPQRQALKWEDGHTDEQFRQTSNHGAKNESDANIGSKFVYLCWNLRPL